MVSEKETQESEIISESKTSSSEDDRYNPQHISDEDPKYTEVTLTAKELKTTYRSGDTLDVKVASKYGITYGIKDGMSLKDASVKLQVKVDGKWKTAYQFANAKGVAKFKLSSLPVGKYDVKFSCNDQNFESATFKTTITINKAKPKVTAPLVVNQYNKKANFKITVKTEAKKAITGLKLKVKVYTGKKAKAYTLKTNKNGVAILNTKKLSVGTHKVLISSGNNNFKISKKSSIIIGKRKH